MPRNLLRKSNLFSNLGNLHDIKNAQKGFAIIFKPKSDKILLIKKQLQQTIDKIHRVNKSKLYKIFQ